MNLVIYNIYSKHPHERLVFVGHTYDAAQFTIKDIGTHWHFMRQKLDFYRQIESNSLEFMWIIRIIGNTHGILFSGEYIIVSALKLLETL